MDYLAAQMRKMFPCVENVPAYDKEEAYDDNNH